MLIKEMPDINWLISFSSPFCSLSNVLNLVRIRGTASLISLLIKRLLSYIPLYMSRYQTPRQKVELVERL